MRIKKKDRKAAKRQRSRAGSAHRQATLNGLEGLIKPQSLPRFDDDYLEQLDRWLDGQDEGTAPGDVLRARGFVFGDDAPLDEQALHAKLWELIAALGSIGVYLSSTDHLSDRELYRKLVAEVLPQKTMLRPDDPAYGDHWDPIGGGSEEDTEIYLTYYADEEERAGFVEFGPLPERKPRPYDRDEDLPTHEARLAAERAN